MNAPTEARLAGELSDQLSALEALESFNRENQTELSIVWRDGTVSNTAASINAMTHAVTEIVVENLDDLFATAVARQREKVSDARRALLDMVFGKTVAEPAAAGAVAPAHDLTAAEIDAIGSAEDAVDATLAAGAAANDADTGIDF